MSEQDVFAQEPPHKQYMEQVVLGGMLGSRDALDEAVADLHDTDFYDPRHQTIFAALVALSQQTDDDITPVVLAEKLADGKQLDNVGGAEYLADLVTAAPASSTIGFAIGQLRDAAAQRRVIQVGTRIAQLGHTPDADAKDVIDLAVSEALTLENPDKEADCKPAHEVAWNMLKLTDDIQQGVVEEGIMTGFRDIDRVTHGLQPDQMIVVAGRPGMGKSTLGMDFARHAAIEDDIPTVIFSLEMSGSELMQRMFSAETGVPLNAFRDPLVRTGNDGRSLGITEDRWDSINAFYEKLKTKPLYIDDSADLTLTDIKAKCRRLQKTIGLKLVIIDYLQLLTVTGRSSDNRQQEVSAMSRDIKKLAKRLHVPVVVLSQLNRGPEMRNDKKPQLSDLRESGSIEQDADVVFLVHRPDVYDKEDRPGEADIIMAKHRNGPTDTFNLAFLGSNSRFQDMPQDYTPSGVI